MAREVPLIVVIKGHEPLEGHELDRIVARVAEATDDDAVKEWVLSGTTKAIWQYRVETQPGLRGIGTWFFPRRLETSAAAILRSPGRDDLTRTEFAEQAKSLERLSDSLVETINLMGALGHEGSEELFGRLPAFGFDSHQEPLQRERAWVDALWRMSQHGRESAAALRERAVGRSTADPMREDLVRRLADTWESAGLSFKVGRYDSGPWMEFAVASCGIAGAGSGRALARKEAAARRRRAARP